MDCRIQVADEEDVRTIAIVGCLLGEHVPALLSACGTTTPLRVNLSEVLSVDAIAADALRRIRAGGAQFVDVPPYIQFKLDATSSKPPGHEL